MTCPSMQYSTVSRWHGVGATNPTSLLSKPAVAATATQTLPFLVPRVQPDIPSMPPWPHSLADFSVLSMQTPLTPLLPAVLGCSNRPFVLEVQEKHKNQNLPIPRRLPSKDPEMCENVLNSAFCPCVQPFYAGGLSTKLHSIQLNLKNLTRKGSIP